jgi:hypothetical protein
MGAAFERVIRLQLEQFTPEEAKRRHIAIARRALAHFMARQATKPGVAIEVDGHPATSEDGVQPYGVIVYRFTRMREIAAFALAQARALSPKKSGRYKRSWFFMVDEAEIALNAIPHTARVVLTNDQPYARKIHVGATGFKAYVPPGIVEKVRQLVLRKYRNVVDVEIQFLTLAGGYILQKSGGSGKDRQPGSALTYPALVITPKRYI